MCSLVSSQNSRICAVFVECTLMWGFGPMKPKKKEVQFNEGLVAEGNKWIFLGENMTGIQVPRQ